MIVKMTYDLPNRFNRYAEPLINNVLEEAGCTSITKTKEPFPEGQILAEVKKKPRDLIIHGVTWEVVEP
ncbi:hypothetical protein [Bacillus pseudomycoides]|uniref:hypothetical protein n=1 Tax=Bacillus pseudomycoides TaxID=64104 RepID=UPI000534C4B3|nr:hypothetical protein [Bacillus pseudomycoides]MDR4190776.1 hypothetical protein [Bacillus pseudomycoides]MED0857995.1 hypothetical protein [Bacillus pseudomycoides]MED1625166.1 hypothetical protein [Bacillus pseudomycoides]PEI91198.1 hypothetical protein CN679_14825 [Bacillus pseudomycoides]PEO73373.1 hypothetical protein CN571_31255 [Bacillus pseudomycoides]